MNNYHRFIFLDGMRGIAAIVVVLYHFTHRSNVDRLFPNAPLAVDLFFCLSGFVIAWAYYNKLLAGMSLNAFMIKRLIRLYPMYLTGLFFGIAAYILKYYYQVNADAASETATSVLFNMFYLPYFISHAPGQIKHIFLVNSAFWSLFFELIANLAFVLTIKLSKKQLLLLTAVFGLWLGWEGHVFHTSPGWSTENFIGGFPRVGYAFMWGVLIFKYFDFIKSLPRISPLIIVLVFLMLTAIPNIHWLYWYFSAVFLIPLTVMTGTIIIIKNELASKVLEYLGWISYPLYCLHVPIINIWMVLRPNPEYFYYEMSAVVSLSFLITHIVAKYFDEPIRLRLGEFTRSKSSLIAR